MLAPDVLLVAMMASRSEVRPSAPGRLLMVPVPQAPSALNRGSAVSVRVVTTMVLGGGGEGKARRASEEAMTSVEARTAGKRVDGTCPWSAGAVLPLWAGEAMLRPSVAHSMALGRKSASMACALQKFSFSGLAPTNCSTQTVPLFL